MSVTTAAPDAGRTATPGTTTEARRPSRRTTTGILVRGYLVWLGWLWCTLLVVLTIGLLVVGASDWEPSTSLWSGGGIGWQRWVLFSAGIALTRVFVREFVTRGVTRGRLAESAIGALLVLAAICSAAGAAGYVIEAVIFRSQDWVNELPGGGRFSAGALPRLAVEHALLGAIYFLGGWLIGLGYARVHWAYATLLIPACLAPAAVVEFAVGDDTTNYRIEAFPEALRDPSIIVTLGVAVPVIAATSILARRATRSLPFR
jgi:hypothetical protein